MNALCVWSSMAWLLVIIGIAGAWWAVDSKRDLPIVICVLIMLAGTATCSAEDRICEIAERQDGQ